MKTINYECYRYGSQRIQFQFEDFRLPCTEVQFNQGGPLIELPFFYDGVMVAVIGQKQLVSWQESSLSTRWTVELGVGEPLESPVGCHIVGDFLILSENATLVKVDKKTGQRITSVYLGRLGNSNFLFFPDYDHCYCPIVDQSSSLGYYWLDAKTFHTIKRDERSFRETAGTSEKMVVILGARKSVVCIDARTMEDLWSLETSALPRDTGVDGKGQTLHKVTGGLLIYEGLVIFAVEDYFLYAVHLDSGLLAWSTKSNVRFCEHFGIGPDRRIHFLDPDNYGCIDPKTGELVTEMSFGTTMHDLELKYGFSKPSFSQTHLFFSDGVGAHIVGFNLLTNKVDWLYTCKAGIPKNCSPILVNSRLYTVDLNGELYVFESGVG